MGVFVTMERPTPGMVSAANHSGLYVHPANAVTYPRVQIVSVPDLLAGAKPNLPPLDNAYQAAKRHRRADHTQDTLGF